MTVLVDDLGSWVQLGQISPQFLNFSTFPVLSNTDNTTYRVSVQSTNYAALKSICYLRPVYQFQGNKVVGKNWIKIYPKPEKEIVTIPYDQAFAYEQIFRGFEIIKKLKYRRIGQTMNEENYIVSLEEFLPTQQTLEEINTPPLLTEVNQTLLQEFETLKDQIAILQDSIDNINP